MQYILIFPMLRSKKNLSVVIICVLIAFIYIIMIILIIISLCKKSKIKYYNALINFMRIALPVISLSFFGQIFETFLLIFMCEETVNVDTYNSFECPNKTFYYAMTILCFFAILFLILISYISISIFYKPSFIKDKNNSLTKVDSFPNKVFFVNKILFILLTNIRRKNIIFVWFILVVFLISSYANMIAFTKYNNYINRILLEINKFFSVLLFSFICFLIVGKIFNGLGFNGTIYLYLYSIFIALISAFLYKSNLNSFSYIEFKLLNSGCEQLLYIQNFLNLVRTRHLTREKTLTFDSLILIREENCINKNCKLKKYLKSVEKGQPNDFLLYQYCQDLYEIALKKNPDDIILKINYVVFLKTQMSKTKLAEKVFYTIKYQPFSFEANFMMFYCKKFFEVDCNNDNSEIVNKELNKNIMKKIEYDKLNEEFKNDLIQASSLYYNFWNILNKYHIQGIEDFDKLKNIGKELTILINGIEEKFKILHNVKGDDINLLYLYSGFIKYILGDESKYDDIKNIFASISKVDKIKDFEVDYTNFDLKFFDGSDEYKYMIISAEEENLGTILNISNNAAKIFGYTKQELIGKKFYFLLPCITQKAFESYLINHTNQLKLKFYEALTNKKEYFPQADELFINAKDKSKYLLPIYIKMIFVQTEESNHSYILTISYQDDINLNKINDIFKLGNIFNNKKNKEEKLYKYCIILTDMNFIIQTFTSNCQEHLGLNTHSMTSNLELTQFISEFNDAFYKMIIEKKSQLNKKSEYNYINPIPNHRSERRSQTGMKRLDDDMDPEQKLIYKRYIAEKIYSESKLVTWKSDALENYLAGNKSGVDGTIVNCKLNLNNILSEDNNNEKLFLLIIQKIEFNNKQIGYIFLFRREKVNFFENKETKIISSLNDKNTDNNKNKKPKNILKAHKTTFSKFKSSDNLAKKTSREENNKKTNENNKNEKGIDKVINHSKSQKKIIKKQKSLELGPIPANNKGNIVGIIESIIKNAANDNTNIKYKFIKKCSFKNFSSHYSLVGNDNKNEDVLPEIVSEKKILESTLQSQNYLPKCDFNFSFNMELMSFKPSYDLIKAKDFSELLKKEAQKKIDINKKINNQKETKIKEDSSFYSSNIENESNEKEQNSSSKSFSDYSKKNLPKKISEKKKKEENYNYDINREYYRVSGLNKIKYMIFDFEHEMVIEKEGQKENKPEVENILLNHKLKLPTAMDKDGNDPSIKVNKLLLKYSNKDLIKDNIYVRINSKSQKENSQKLKKQKELCKKIETELNKKEKEISILRYSILCYCYNLILLGMGAFSLYFIISNLSIFKDHLKLIISASLLRHYTNLGIYHTRMYTLSKIEVPNFSLGSSYEKYTNKDIVENRTKYFEDLYEKLENDFYLGSQHLEKMISIDVKMEKHNKENLYRQTFNNILIGNDFSEINVSSSIIVGISQLYSHFNYLIANIDKFKYNSPGILNFMLNSLNTAGIGLNEIIEIYIDEIMLKKSRHVRLTYVILLLYFILLFLLFFPIKINYAHIIIKRNSYISTFYQLNISFIRTSLLKCEKFLNQLNPNELISNQEEKKEGMDNTISISNFDDNLISNEQAKVNIVNQTNHNLIGKRIIKTKTNMRLILIFISFLLFIFLFMLIPLLGFSNYINNFEIMALYLYHMLHYHNNIIKIYIAFNEYLFYEAATIENIPVLVYLEKTINNTYDTLAEELNYIGTNSEKISGLHDIYTRVQKEQLCNSTLCDPYIETITSLGFYSFVAFMITEIKVKVNYVRVTSRIFLNITQDARTLILFNLLHYDVDIMFNAVALHIVEEEMNLTVNTIFQNINSRNNVYIAVYIVYFIIVLFLYFFYWSPFVTDAQEQIYKTKEVLKIIPVEILESQTNIKNLIGISGQGD